MNPWVQIGYRISGYTILDCKGSGLFKLILNQCFTICFRHLCEGGDP